MKKNIHIFGGALLILTAAWLMCWIYNSRQNPLVSVVMPVYNRADFLPRSIESVLGQTYRNFEFIIIDDGSTDKSLEVIKEYAQKDGRIILIENEKNRGISYARNRGNDIARGKYLMVMDSDDVNLPTRMEKQVRFLEKNQDIDMVISMRSSNKPGMNPQFESPMSQYEGYQVVGHFLGHPEWMFRRSFLTENNIRYNAQFSAAVDYDFVTSFMKKQGKIGYIEDILLERRFHRTNGADYYSNQNKNVDVIMRDFWRAFGVPEKMIPKHRPKKYSCDIYRFIVHANKEKHFINQESLENYITKRCGKIDIATTNDEE